MSSAAAVVKENFLITYYTTQLDDVFRKTRRSYWMAITLLCIQFYWRLCLVCPSVDDSLAAQQFDFRAKFSFLKGASTTTNMIVFIFIINTVIITLFSFDILLFLSRKRMSVASENTFKFVLSFLIQIYSYTFFIPAMYHSLNIMMDHPLAFISVFTTLFLELFLLLHDKDYNYIRVDYLDRRNSFKWDIAEVLFDSVAVIFLAQKGDRHGVFLFGILCSLFGIVHIYTNMPFTNKLIKHFSMSFTIFLLLFSFQQLASIVTSTSSAYLDFIVAMILVPISHKFSITFQKMHLSFDIDTLNRVNSIHHYNLRVDHVIRSIVCCNMLEIEDYLRWSQSVLVESIITQHNITCEAAPHCFCAGKEGNEAIDLLKSKEIRQKYLLDFIEQKFQRVQSGKMSISNSISNPDFHFSQIHFLFEKKNSKILAFNEVMKLMEKKNLGLRDQFFLNRLLKDIKLQFQSTSNFDRSSDSEPASSAGESEQQQQTPSSFGNFMVGIKFDEDINRYNTKFNEGVSLKHAFLTLISNDFINLNDFEVQSISYIAARTELKASLKKLCEVNRSGSKIRYFVDNYIMLMSFVEKKKDFLGDKLDLAANKKKKLDQLSLDIRRIITSKDICCVFVSLIGKIGIIKRVQSRIESFFGWRAEDVLGKNIDMFMPTSVSQFHDLILKEYINDKKQLRASSLSADSIVPLALAKNKAGWGIPISIRTRSECFAMECGISAEISLIRNEGVFVMTKGHSFHVQLMSEKLFTSVLQKYFDQEDLPRIQLSRIIPGLAQLRQQSKKTSEQQLSNSNFFSSIAILAKQNPQLPKIKNSFYFKKTGHQNYPFSENIEQLVNQNDFYKISVKIYDSTNPYLEYNILQINSFQRISEPAEIKSELVNLKKLTEINPHIESDTLIDSEIHPSKRYTADTMRTERYTNTITIKQLTEMDNSSVKLMNQPLGLMTGGEYSPFETIRLQQSKFSPNVRQQGYSIESHIFKQNESNFEGGQQQLEDSNLLAHQSLQTDSIISKYESPNLIGLLNDKNNISNLKLSMNRSVASVKQQQLPAAIQIEDMSLQMFTLKVQNDEERKAESMMNCQLKEQLSDQFEKKENGDGYDNFSLYDNDEEDGEDLKKSMRIAASSVETGNSKSHSRQRIVKEALLLPPKSIVLQILTFLGFIALVILLLVTFIQSLTAITKLGIVEQCGNFITWPMSVRVEHVTMLRTEGLLRLSNTGYFPLMSSEEYRQQQLAIGEVARKNLFNLYYEFLTADLSTLTFFEFALNDILPFDQTKDEITLTDAQKVTKNYATKYRSNYSLTYQIPFYGLTYAQLSRKKWYEQNYMMIILDNFPLLNPQLLLIQAGVYNLAQQCLNEIQDEIKWILILVIVMNSILIGSIFPIFFYAQRKKEQLYQIFSTIQVSHLKSMIQPVLIFLNQEKIIKTSLFPEHVIKKRKAITETSKLIKFKPIFILYSLICFTILIVQPVTNVILTSSFKTQSLASLDLLKNIYGLKALFTSNLGLYWEYLYKVLVPSALFYNVPYYTNRFPILAKQNQAQLEQMYVFVNSAHNSANYKKDLFDKFLFKILEGDICQAVLDFPEYVDSYNQFNQGDCSNFQKGILHSGFQINVKSFISVFSDMFNLFQMSDQTQQFAAIMRWEADLNIKQFDDYSTILFKTVNIMKLFMTTILSDQMSEMVIIKRFLDTFQIFALLLIFFYGWVKFYFQIKTDMQEARLPFSILSIDIIFENPYIQSLIK